MTNLSLFFEGGLIHIKGFLKRNCIKTIKAGLEECTYEKITYYNCDYFNYGIPCLSKAAK